MYFMQKIFKSYKLPVGPIQPLLTQTTIKCLKQNLQVTVKLSSNVKSVHCIYHKFNIFKVIK